jgi:hypothetical protein
MHARGGSVGGRPRTPTVVAESVERDPPYLAALAPCLTDVLRGAPIEFGASRRTDRSLGALAAEASRGNSPRARWERDRLVLPGTASAVIPTPRSLAEMGGELSSRLPYRRYRLKHNGAGLTLEGKVNPWVRLATHHDNWAGHGGKPKYKGSNANAQPPGQGWQQVQNVTLGNGNWVNGFTSNGQTYDKWGRLFEEAHGQRTVQKHYAVATLGNDGDDANRFVFGKKSLVNPGGNQAAYAGGLPAPPGGNREFGASTPQETITKEITEELHGQYQLQGGLGDDLGATTEGTARYATSAAVVSAVPHPPLVPNDPAYQETSGPVVVDARHLYDGGVRHDHPDDAILKAVAGHAGSPYDNRDQVNQPTQQQWNEYLAANNYPMRAALQRIKGRLQAIHAAAPQAQQDPALVQANN